MSCSRCSVRMHFFFAGGGSNNIPSWRYCAAHDASFCTNWWNSAIIDVYIVDAGEDESSAITRMPIYLVETQRDCKEKWQPFPIDSSQNKAAAEFMAHSCFASAKLTFLVAHKYHRKNDNFSPKLMLSVWEKEMGSELGRKKNKNRGLPLLWWSHQQVFTTSSYILRFSFQTSWWMIFRKKASM